ncbi:uncharacterized protein LOC141686999 isoform X2 [Apium graveolens]|uniref:uncharacterized protein LOC141686999 isoform X2 n=1 Tax=Apium graveolens TaxID=4045 RepID=UPI003D7A8C05
MQVHKPKSTMNNDNHDSELSSWIENYNNEISLGQYVATRRQQGENETLYDYVMATPPQQAEFDSVMKFLQASQQLTEPTTEFVLGKPYEFVQPVTGLPQQVDPQPAVKLFQQPVTTPPPPPQQAEDALWIPKPPQHQSDYMPPLEPGLVEPSVFNNNHHYFTAPAVHNSPWAVSPFPSSTAPIYYEPAVETEPTPVVATVEEAEPTSVVIAVEETKEKGSTSVVKEENQAEEQDDGSEPLAKRIRRNKSHCGSERIDKASLLEETFRYLKSLQYQVNMLSLGGKMRMSMAMGMNMAMVPFPAFVPVSTLQHSANTAAQLPTVANINGHYLGFYPQGYLQDDNNATLQPRTSKTPGEMEDCE